MGSRRPAEFVVSVRAEGAGAPAAVRLRGWLKTALRRFGLRVVAVTEVQAGPGGAPAGGVPSGENRQPPC